MLSLLLILLYTALLLTCLLRISRKYRNNFSVPQITTSFITKVIFGMAYGFIFWKLYNGDDTWKYHDLGLVEYHKLLHQPLRFFSDSFSGTPGRVSLEAMYETQNSFWNHLEETIFIRILAIFDVLSFGRYYVNVVLFGFLVYLGNLLLIRLLLRYFPDAGVFLNLVVFYFPVTLFWLSGIRKEGFLLIALAAVLFFFDRLLRRAPKQALNAVMFFTGLLALGLIRNFVLMCVAPALLAWLLCRYMKFNPLVVFTVVYTGAVFLFFYTDLIPGFPNLAQKVTRRQYDFFSLEANTTLPLDSLHGTGASFLRVLPQALNHTFLRPYITESKSLLQLVSALDIMLFFGLMALAVLFRRTNWQIIFRQPVVLSLLFTAFFAYLIIGYTVPFPGAFVRYKSLFELLFLCCFALIIDPQRVRKGLNIK